MILLLSFNSYAQIELSDEQIRINEIEAQLLTIDINGNSKDSQEIIAKLLTKCSIENENSAFFHSKLFDVNNAEYLNCFLNKKSEVDSDDVAKKIKKQNRKDKALELSNYDCSKVKDDYAKLLCEERQ